jgi:hypothetical protein
LERPRLSDGCSNACPCNLYNLSFLVITTIIHNVEDNLVVFFTTWHKLGAYVCRVIPRLVIPHPTQHIRECNDNKSSETYFQSEFWILGILDNFHVIITTIDWSINWYNHHDKLVSTSWDLRSTWSSVQFSTILSLTW